MAAMGSELVRSTDQTRNAVTSSFRKIAETMAPFMQAQDKEAGLDMALSLLTNMVGALTVARMVNDPVLSDRILAVTQRRINSSVNPSAPAQQDAA
jgi:TetR/AcrR family transcriptional repressor of nem operon